MNITKQITVIDRNKIKKGDKINLKNTKGGTSINGTVAAVLDSCISVEQNGFLKRYNADDLRDYDIDKITGKADRFNVGQLYRVEDTFSCDKFDVVILGVSSGMISAMRLKTATAISIKEDEIDARYRFSKIKTVEDHNASTNARQNDEAESLVNEMFKIIGVME